MYSLFRGGSLSGLEDSPKLQGSFGQKEAGDESHDWRLQEKNGRRKEKAAQTHSERWAVECCEHWKLLSVKRLILLKEMQVNDRFLQSQQNLHQHRLKLCQILQRSVFSTGELGSNLRRQPQRRPSNNPNPRHHRPRGTSQLLYSLHPRRSFVSIFSDVWVSLSCLVWAVSWIVKETIQRTQNKGLH